MTEKLSWTELRKLLATRAGVSEKEANEFLSAMVEQLAEALKTDKQVKINGLGTFRLQAVAPRKSVNVTSGEAIVIEGYNKIAFTPEAGVKELIENTPVDSPAEVEGEVNPLKKLGEQAEEIVDLLTDLGQAPHAPAKEEEPEGEAEPAEPESVPEPVEPEPAVPDDEPATESAAPEETAEPKKEEPAPTPTPQSKPKEKKKKNGALRFLRDTLICVVCLLLVLLIGYFFLRSQLTQWLESLGKQPEPIEQVIEPAEPVVAEPIPAEPEEEEPVVEEEPYSDLITTESMHEASRLTWMSKRYYGEKKFWVYIYDANKDHITNPSKIKVGTPIRIPRLTAEQMDTTLEQTRINLERLTREAEEACKR